jgi:hypothetical protein
MNRVFGLAVAGLVATTAVAGDSMPARAAARGGVTDSYCKDPATQKAVVAAMNQQGILSGKVRSVRFTESDPRGFCVYAAITPFSSFQEFWVTPLSSQRGAPRFKFQGVD